MQTTEEKTVACERRYSSLLARLTTVLIWLFYKLDQRAIAMEIMDTIKDQIENNPILLYMKGSPNQPMCGFSARTVQAVMECGQKFAYVDVLSNPEIRANLPTYANWPTFPQLWVKGELVGGCDIVTDMFDKGELKSLLDEAVPAE
jgi:monothiol glutaredoxin